MSKRTLVSAEDVAREVSASAKYRLIDPSLVGTVSRIETPKADRAPEAVKRVKRKLHQMVGAYLDAAMPFAEWIERLESAGQAERPGICREILEAHASTRERLPEMAAFFEAAFRGVPAPKIVADLACGLNPLARPFMPLPPETMYQAFDVHLGMVGFVREALRVLGYRVEADAWNLLDDWTLPPVDVVLLLKALPCLDQAKAAASQRLLARLDAPLIVVSFPTASLGGARRGMESFYREQFRAMLPAGRFDVEETRFQTELMFRLWRRDPAREASA